MIVKCREKNLRCVGYRIIDIDDAVLDHCVYPESCQYKLSATDDTEQSYIQNLKRK